jgi:thiol-disulfide isomerase/thioredoxin
MIAELVVSIVVISIAIAIFYAIRGFLPASRMIEQLPPLTSNGLDGTQAKFMFFYTTWCGWSKKAQPIWASFKQTLKNTPVKYGGKQVVFEEINADADKGKTALYKVEGYPTFKVETSDRVYEFVGSPSVQAFDSFLQTAIGAKEPM